MLRIPPVASARGPNNREADAGSAGPRLPGPLGTAAFDSSAGS